MFIVLHGDDAFTRDEELATLKARMGDPAMAELNTSHLDGRETTMGEIQHHCGTLPFLSDRRLVIVTGLLRRLSSRSRSSAEQAFLSELVDYLPHLLSTTRLVFVEDTTLRPHHPVLALVGTAPKGYAKVFGTPTGSALTHWIRTRAQHEGARIEPRAAETLRAFVGKDLSLLQQEIHKLSVYTAGERPITDDDVKLLTPAAREESVFAMVDALGRRDGATAARIYHNLLEAGEHPLSLFGMITRQFRLMIQAKELAPALITPKAIARELGQNPYPIKKILAQSTNYSLEQLDRVYHKLLDTDVAIKTGQIAPELALDILIAGLSRVP